MVPLAGSGPVFLGPLSSAPRYTFLGPPRDGYRPPRAPPRAPAPAAPGTFRWTVPSAAFGTFLAPAAEAAAGVVLAGAGAGDESSPSGREFIVLYSGRADPAGHNVK